FIVQNVYYLRGKIRKDITLDSSRFWIVDGEVTLMDGATMTILPGTQVQFGGGNNKHGYLNSNKGSLLCKGTEDEPIMLFKGKKSYFSGIWAIGDGYTNNNSYLSYTIIDNLGLYIQKSDHCKIYPYSPLAWADDNYEGAGDGYYRLEIAQMKNTIVYNREEYLLFEQPLVIIPEAQNCMFNSINHFSFFMESRHNNNVYVGEIAEDNASSIPDFMSDYNTDYNWMKNNAVLNNYNNPNKIWRRVSYDTLVNKNYINYYGTDNPQLICNSKIVEEDYLEIKDFCVAN
nr:hypothetical protein [Ruminococcus sp.]